MVDVSPERIKARDTGMTFVKYLKKTAQTRT